MLMDRLSNPLPFVSGMLPTGLHGLAKIRGDKKLLFSFMRMSNMCLEEQIISFKSRPQLEGFNYQKEQTESHENCVPL